MSATSGSRRGGHRVFRTNLAHVESGDEPIRPGHRRWQRSPSAADAGESRSAVADFLHGTRRSTPAPRQRPGHATPSPSWIAACSRHAWRQSEQRCAGTSCNLISATPSFAGLKLMISNSTSLGASSPLPEGGKPLHTPFKRTFNGRRQSPAAYVKRYLSPAPPCEAVRC